MKVRLVMMAVLWSALALAASPPDYPVVAGVRADGEMLRVGIALDKRGFVMTGYLRTAPDKEIGKYRGPVYNMQDVDVDLVADGNRKVCEIDIILPAGDEWRQVRFVYDVVASSLAEQYGKPRGAVEIYGDRSDYSPATKMIRLQRGYVDVRQWWHVGPWTVTESVGYANDMGIVKVRMVRDREDEYAAEKKSRKARKEKAPREPRPRKEKPKKEKGDKGGKQKAEKVQNAKEEKERPVAPVAPASDTVTTFVVDPGDRPVEMKPVTVPVEAPAAKDTVRERGEEYKVIFNVRYSRKAALKAR